MEDQKFKKDAGKISYRYAMASQSLDGIAQVRNWAVKNKYPDPYGYRHLDPHRILDGVVRHIMDLMEHGIDHINEEDAGLPSLWHAQTGLAFLEHFRREMIDEDYKEQSRRALQPAGQSKG